MTDRLVLRRWRPEDIEPFARLNADPQVMEHMPSCMTRDETELMVQRVEAHFEQHGFGLWAAEHLATQVFLGYVGLLIPTFDVSFMPCVEIGWRLAVPYWGQGYATEGAREVVRHGFLSLGLPEIVSFTVPANIRSRRVMEKLGMTYSPKDDFAHPRLPDNHPLKAHVLYRLTSDDWAVNES